MAIAKHIHPETALIMQLREQLATTEADLANERELKEAAVKRASQLEKFILGEINKPKVVPMQKQSAPEAEVMLWQDKELVLVTDRKPRDGDYVTYERSNTPLIMPNKPYGLAYGGRYATVRMYCERGALLDIDALFLSDHVSGRKVWEVKKP